MRQLVAHPTFTDDALRGTAKRLAETLARALGEADAAVYDYDYDGLVEEIESEPRSGFWPWTSGGFHVVLPASLAHHVSTGNPPAPIQPLIDAGNRIIAEEWQRYYPDRPPLLDAIHAGDPEAEAWETEGWMADDDTYFWKARVMFLAPDDPSYRDEEAPEPGKPYVFVDAYLNTDLNYGRDSIRWLTAYGSDPNQTVGDFKRAFTLDTFARLTDADLDRLATDAVKELP